MEDDVMAVFSPRRGLPRRGETEPLREARAELVSLGGAILLAICLVITAVAIAVFQLPTTGAQRVIAVVLALASWIYFFDSITEKLRLIDNKIYYDSWLTANRSFQLVELEAVYLIHQGFNLEKGFESIVFHRQGRSPERVALGPCWQRHKLESLMQGIEQAMHDPHLLEEIR